MTQQIKSIVAQIEGEQAVTRFLELVTGEADAAVEWRLIKKDAKQLPNGKRAADIINEGGTYSELRDALHGANEAGYDVYIVLNGARGGFTASQGNGADDSDIAFTRAWFVDRDASNADAAAFSKRLHHLTPHFATSRGEENYHVGWRAAPNTPAEAFRPVQRRLAAHYRTDPSVCNPARVIRVPGFFNRKGGKRIPVVLHDFTAGVPVEALAFDHFYTREEIEHGLSNVADDDVRDDAPEQGGRVGAEALTRMLATIPPDLSRDDWRKCLGAVKVVEIMDREVDKLELLDDWSAGRLAGIDSPPSSYQGREDVEKEFEGWKPDKRGGSGFGALVHLAKNYHYNGPVAWQPAPPPDNESLMARFDGDALMSRFEGTFSTAPENAGRYLRSYRVSRLDELPDPEWLVHRIIPRNAVGYFYGGSGSMKSFTVQDLMMSGALPLEDGANNVWMSGEGHEGFEIMGRLRSAFVILEGERGLKKRVQGWMTHHDVSAEELDGYFTLIPDAPDIRTTEGRDKLARTIRRDLDGHDPDIIALDTAMVLSAANKLSLIKPDEGQLFAGLVRDVRAMFPGSAIVIVHHTGKDAERGMVGGYNQYAGADFVFEFVRPNRKAKPPLVEVHNRKDRDEEDETHFNIQGRVIDLGQDRKGKPVSTLTVCRSAGVEDGLPNSPKLTTIDAAIQVIEEAFVEGRRIYGPKALAEGTVTLQSPGHKSGTEDHTRAIKTAQTAISHASREWTGKGAKKVPGKLHAYKAGETYTVPRHLAAQAQANVRTRAEERTRHEAMDVIPADEDM